MTCIHGIINKPQMYKPIYVYYYYYYYGTRSRLSDPWKNGVTFVQVVYNVIAWIYVQREKEDERERTSVIGGGG